jgi:para-nitrobenzyl esterase
VLVVTVNYRLGPLGWFRHPALRAASSDPRDASGNFATLDLIRALVWVRDNAAAFGGDPARVTIFGESAGGANVYSLLASPLADGLFQRAIVQSGSTRSLATLEAERRADAQPAGLANSSAEIVLRLVVARGRAADRTAAKVVVDAMSDSEVAALLRGATAEELIKLYDTRRGGGGLIDVPQLFRDGHVLPEQPVAEYLASPGGLPNVPVILGTNRDESRLFQALDPASVRWLLGLFPRARDPRAYAAWSRYASGLWRAGGADEVAQAIVRAGARNVFVYRFDWDEEPSSWLADMSGLLGAAHGMEISFVFGVWDFGSVTNRIFTPANQAGRVELSDAMMAYWARFAATGDPGRGSGGLPRWERWSESSAEAPRSIVFDTAAGGGIRMMSEVTTRATLAERLAGDAEFRDVAERCSFASRLGGYGRGFDAEHMTTLGCSGTPEVASPPR